MLVVFISTWQMPIALNRKQQPKSDFGTGVGVLDSCCEWVRAAAVAGAFSEWHHWHGTSRDHTRHQGDEGGSGTSTFFTDTHVSGGLDWSLVTLAGRNQSVKRKVPPLLSLIGTTKL